MYKVILTGLTMYKVILTGLTMYKVILTGLTMYKVILTGLTMYKVILTGLTTKEMSRSSRTGGERLKRQNGSHRANNATRNEVDFHFYIPVTQARPTFGAAASRTKIKWE
ncbi:hypothetical protein BgiBS90_000861 [Biomphalaria glabrata]|nr:hypothetical protein BgiBS90_000861 [Biomphalaria glabrata]